MSKYLLSLLLVATFITACNKEPEDHLAAVKGVWQCTGFNKIEEGSSIAPDTTLYITRDVGISYSKDSVAVFAGFGYDLGMKFIDMGAFYSKAQFPENIKTIMEFNEYIDADTGCGNASKKLIYYPEGDSIMYFFAHDGCGKHAWLVLYGKRKK